MSQLERRKRHEVDPYAPAPPSSWREARAEQSREFIAGNRLSGGARLSFQTARYGKQLMDEIEDLGPLGNLIVQSFVYKALEVRDGFMDL